MKLIQSIKQKVGEDDDVPVKQIGSGLNPL